MLQSQKSEVFMRYPHSDTLKNTTCEKQRNRFPIIMLRLTLCRLKRTFKALFTKKQNNRSSYDCCGMQKIYLFFFLATGQVSETLYT